MADLRKVQQTPTGTFFVCLPRDWANQNGLKKGTLVSLDVTNDGKLLVDAEYDAEPSAKTTTLTAGPYLGQRNYWSLPVRLRHHSTLWQKTVLILQVRSIVKSTASSLSGLEIFEETSSTISLHSLMQQPSGLIPEKILHRNYVIVAGMTRDAANSFIYGDVELAKSVIERDAESNRLYFLLVRILRTIIQNPRLTEKLGITPIECLDYRLAASLLEGIGDVGSGCFKNYSAQRC